MVNQAEAQTQRFDMPLLSEAQKEQIKKLAELKLPRPQVLVQVSLPEIPKPEKQQQISSKNKPEKTSFKGDFHEIYKQAAGKYGLDWHILAAIHKIETGQSGDTLRKSNCGATGPMQFIPSTFKAYAVDGNGDGVKDIGSVYDSIFTAANYLSANIADGGNIDFAIYRYNHSTKYVNEVKFLASQIN